MTPDELKEIEDRAVAPAQNYGGAYAVVERKLAAQRQDILRLVAEVRRLNYEAFNRGL